MVYRVVKLLKISRTIAAICSRLQSPCNALANSGLSCSTASLLNNFCAALFGRWFERRTSSQSAISPGLSKRFAPASGISISKTSSTNTITSTVSRLSVARGFIGKAPTPPASSPAPHSPPEGSPAPSTPSSPALRKTRASFSCPRGTARPAWDSPRSAHR